VSPTPTLSVVVVLLLYYVVVVLLLNSKFRKRIVSFSVSVEVFLAAFLGCFCPKGIIGCRLLRLLCDLGDSTIGCFDKKK